MSYIPIIDGAAKTVNLFIGVNNLVRGSSRDLKTTVQDPQKGGEVWVVAALIEIIIHPYLENQETGKGTLYKIENCELVPMLYRDYQCLGLNVQGPTRAIFNWMGENANHKALMQLKGKIEKFIDWYAHDEDIEVKNASKQFLQAYVKPGLESIQKVYDQTAMRGEIHTWIDSINNLPNNGKKAVSEQNQRTKKLFSKELLTRLNTICKGKFDGTWGASAFIVQMREIKSELMTSYHMTKFTNRTEKKANTIGRAFLGSIPVETTPLTSIKPATTNQPEPVTAPTPKESI